MKAKIINFALEAVTRHDSTKDSEFNLFHCENKWLTIDELFDEILGESLPKEATDDQVLVVVTDDEIEKMALERFKVEAWRMKLPITNVTEGSLQINHKLAYIEGFKKCLTIKSSEVEAVKMPSDEVLIEYAKKHWNNESMNPYFFSGYKHGFEKHLKITDQIKEKLSEFLEAHEQWEADFINEDKCWEHSGNPRFNNKIYDSFLQLQSLRNETLSLYKEELNKKKC